MKRPIKFRARDALGKASYVDWDVILHPSVTLAQLVGYDRDGREVYEGDIIVDENGDEMPAMLFAVQFDGKLKEAEQ